MLNILTSLFKSKGKSNIQATAQHRFFFVENTKIKRKDEKLCGFIENIIVDDDTAFLEIPVKPELAPQVHEKAFGVSKVEQKLGIYFASEDIFKKLNALKASGKRLSILHISPERQCMLFGEHNGMAIQQLGPNFVQLEGEESDIFNKVSIEYADKLAGNV